MGPTPRNQLSFSRIKTFFQCPLRYRYRYLKGLPEAFRSVESHLGVTVHGVLEWVYEQRDLGAVPSREQVAGELTRRWDAGWSDDIRVVQGGETPASALRLGREMLERYVLHTLPSDPSTTLALEQRLSKQVLTGMVFTGKADRIARTPDGRLLVVDYKTSAQLGDSSDLSEGLQVPLYAVCAMDRYGDDTALAGYHYLQQATTRWQRLSREQGTLVIERFCRLAEQVLAATELPPRPGAFCHWCGYNQRCDAFS